MPTTPENITMLQNRNSEMQDVEKLLSKNLHINSEERNKYASDVSTISTFESEEYRRLHDILSSIEQLSYFQTYLQNIHAHENLLFIEALSELRHEKCLKKIEIIVHRLV
jgi:muconolactone delta-isomerase